MSTRRPTKDDKAMLAVRLPTWLVLAVKYDAVRQGVNYSRHAQDILSRNVSPQSRRHAEESLAARAAS